MVLYVLGSAFYFIHHNPGPSQATAPLSSLAAASPNVSIGPGTRFISAIPQLVKPVKRGVRVKTLAVQDLEHPMPASVTAIPVQAFERTYHCRDTSGQVLTALDYRVSTTLQVSTSIE